LAKRFAATILERRSLWRSFSISTAWALLIDDFGEAGDATIEAGHVAL
jgi:hypothetical protein